MCKELMCCEVCGRQLTSRGKCPNSKYHEKIKKIQSLHEDGVLAYLGDFEEFKESAREAVDTAETVEETVRAYKKLIYAYYVRFMQINPTSSISLETYSGLLLCSGIYDMENHTDAYKLLTEEYGAIFGLKKGCTYRFEDGLERYIENSLFRAYFYNDKWYITEKSSGCREEVSNEDLRKTSKEEYVMGYAKCLFKS